MADTTDFDIILWGGTSFVGRLVAQHLSTQYGVNRQLRWAIGGRNAQKLTMTRDTLGDDARGLELFVGDAHDPRFLAQMVQKTKVVLSTVGPYARHGGNLIAACAANGTDYCDLSGEIPFIRQMMDLHAHQARQSGARLLTCCGIDSVPSDLGVYILGQVAHQRLGSSIAHVTNEVVSFRGGFSGGTLLSLGLMRNAAANDSKVAEILGNPYAICPPGRRSGVVQPDVDAVVLSDSGAWLGPFFMAIVNTRVVHATNAHLHYPYGSDFTYSEGMNVGGKFAARLLAAVSGAYYRAYRTRFLRALLETTILPAPGKGPSKAARDKGHFEFRMIARTRSDHRLQLVVRGDRDPGYGASSRMIGEVAVCLAKDLDRKHLQGGFWTPAAAIADEIVPRLIANAGLEFRLLTEEGGDWPVSALAFNGTYEGVRADPVNTCAAAGKGTRPCKGKSRSRSIW